MRILKLRFQNLNSLAGVWEIDFTAPDYSSGAIFAIIGPTGSGKTTILDAISLALYGKTPRLEKISKINNEIMTRHTKECFAEVDFETSKGKYRCYWGQKRAHRYPYALQPPKHEVFDEKGEIHASKKSDVKSEIINVTGLDFNQFTRSVLLAQGKFAAFLDADPEKERSPILEKITGTEIYTTISKEVHKRKSDVMIKLEELQSNSEMIAVLSLSEEEDLNKKKNEAEKTDREHSDKIRDLEGKISWRKQLDYLQNEIDALNKEKTSFDIEKEKASTDLECLHLAIKAKTIEPDFIYLTTKREQRDENLAQLRKCQDLQPTLRQDYDESVRVENNISKNLDTFERNWEPEKTIITQVRELDSNIHHENVRLKELESNQQDNIDKCKQERKKLNNCDENLQKIKTDLLESEKYLLTHQNDKTLNESISALDPRVGTYRSLDGSIKYKKSQLDDVKKDLESSNDLVRSQKTDLDKKKKLQSSKSAESKQIQQKISKLLNKQNISDWRKKDAVFVHDIEKINLLKASVETSKKSDSEIKRLKKESDELTKKYRNHVKTLDKLFKEKKKLTGLIDDLEEQVKQHNQARDLDKERKKLEDQKPCPLCGSLDHPYAKGNIPVPDKTIKKLEGFKRSLGNNADSILDEETEKVRTETDITQNKKDQKTWKEQVQIAEKEWTKGCKEFGFDIKTTNKISAITNLLQTKEREQKKCHAVVETYDDDKGILDEINAKVLGIISDVSPLEKTYNSTVDTCRSQKTEKERLENEIRYDTTDLSEQCKIINRTFEKYGYPETDPEKWSDLIKELSTRYKEYQRQDELKQNLEPQKIEHERRIRSYNSNIEEFKKQLKYKDEQTDLQKGKVDEISTQRKTQYGNKNPDDEERRLTTEINETRAFLEKARADKGTIFASLKSVNDQITSLNNKINAGDIDLEKIEIKFLSSLQNTGFADEIAFSSARLLPETFEKYQKCEESLKNEENRIHGLIQNRIDTLAQEQQKNLTDLSLDKLLDENGELDSLSKELQQKIGEIAGQLNTNTIAKAEYGEHLNKLEKRRAESKRWKRLDELIGHSDGKTFRNIAQKLTFKQLIAHANQHLRSMSDRYLLVPSDKEELDMEVKDKYQAEERRSTKNLSGGESFIVSLALALGLSSMSSKKVQIDSFFLDEGFGTLDDEALDTALVTLSGLQQQEGKLIGIISHVPAIKQRISTQIVVEKKSGGRSRLKGPGVNPPKQVASP